MPKNITVLILSISIAFYCGSAVNAQGPLTTIDAHRYSNLAAAQSYIARAYEKISKAQAEQGDKIRGHALQAKALLMEADDELRMAANAPGDHSK
jgi:hypothetical protein